MEKETRPIFLPIDLKDVFELMEERKTNLIYFVNANGSLAKARDSSFYLDDLSEKAFYVRQDFTPDPERNVRV